MHQLADHRRLHLVGKKNIPITLLLPNPEAKILYEKGMLLAVQACQKLNFCEHKWLDTEEK